MPCTFSIVLVYIVVRRYDSKLYQIQNSLGGKIWPKTVSDTEVFGGTRGNMASKKSFVMPSVLQGGFMDIDIVSPLNMHI